MSNKPVLHRLGTGGNPSFDIDRFIDQGVGAIDSKAIEPEKQQIIPKVDAQPTRASFVQIAQPKVRKTTASYKHKEENHIRLKKMAQRLGLNMGDMIDEALELIFPEWRDRIQNLPPEPDL